MSMFSSISRGVLKAVESRKFWAFVAAFSTSLASGHVQLAVASAIAYIFGEGVVDAVSATKTTA